MSDSSVQLQSLIQKEIELTPSKSISFYRFMELALYHPFYGYYSVPKVKVGKEGDFYTSVSVHPIFSEVIGDVCIHQFEKLALNEPTLIEMGGGTGQFMQGIVKRLKEAAPEVYKRLRIIMIEKSPYHCSLQKSALEPFLPELSVEWFDSLKDAYAKISQVSGIFFSNELFDALPVHIFQWSKKGWEEIHVGWDQKRQTWSEILQPPSLPVAEFLPRQMEESDWVEGQRIEIAPDVADIYADLATLLKEGVVLTIDYGDEVHELYHPSRRDGTLVGYYQHQLVGNPYERVGEQDLTAHVNFTQLMSEGERQGFCALSYERQDEFLVRAGILHKLQEHQDRDPFTSEAMKRNRAIQQLLFPGGLGGRFRVLLQEKRTR